MRRLVLLDARGGEIHRKIILQGDAVEKKHAADRMTSYTTKNTDAIHATR